MKIDAYGESQLKIAGRREKQLKIDAYGELEIAGRKEKQSQKQSQLEIAGATQTASLSPLNGTFNHADWIRQAHVS